MEALTLERGSRITEVDAEERIDSYAPDEAAPCELPTIATLVATLTARNIGSPEEDARTAELARLTAEKLGLEPAGINAVEDASLLRGLGKLWVPDKVLRKRGPLSPREVRTLREHPRAGAATLLHNPELAHLAPIIEASCERFDGKGYPDGRRGSEIPIASRIVYACNAYEAMITDRPYRPALEVESARVILESNSGTQFCPVVIRALLAVLPTSPADVSVTRVAPDEPAPVQQLRSKARVNWARGRTPSRMARIIYPLAALAGLVAGLWYALPASSIEGRCPAPGEGRTLCIIQKVWLHEFLWVALFVCVALLMAHLLVFKLPDVWRRWRAGELRAKPLPPSPDDQALVAASWGWSHGGGQTKEKQEWSRRVKGTVAPLVGMPRDRSRWR